MTVIEASSVSFKSMADGTLRIAFDIEPRHAKEALELFLKPGTPTALAALKTAAQRDPEPDKHKKASTLAYEICRQPEFWHFVCVKLNHLCDSEEIAVQVIKTQIAGIIHRSDLDKFPEAGAKFMNEIYRPYMAYLEQK